MLNDESAFFHRSRKEDYTNFIYGAISRGGGNDAHLNFMLKITIKGDNSVIQIEKKKKKLA